MNSGIEILGSVFNQDPKDEPIYTISGAARNADKPCAVCGKQPRHVKRDGRLAPQCKECYIKKWRKYVHAQ